MPASRKQREGKLLGRGMLLVFPFIALLHTSRAIAQDAADAGQPSDAAPAMDNSSAALQWHDAGPEPEEVPLPPPLPAPPVTAVPPSVPAGDRQAELSVASAKSKGEKGIRHTPGNGIEIPATDGTRLRIRMMVAPMFRTTIRDEIRPDDEKGQTDLGWNIRRARLGFDTSLPGKVKVRFDLHVKMTALVFRQIYGSWKPNKHTELFVGFLKPPGGLEIDSNMFEQPWTDRGVVTLFARVKQEIGFKVEGDIKKTPIFYAASITRPPKSNEDALEEDEPEDQVPIPPIVEEIKLRSNPRRWNTAWRLGVAPSDLWEASLSGNVRFRLQKANNSSNPYDYEYGDNFAEPYDDPWFKTRPWVGIGWHVKADVGLSLPHFRLLTSGGFRRDGRQLVLLDVDTGIASELGGHLNLMAASATIGFSPFGHYGPAQDGAPLLDSWEILAKGEGARIKAVDKPGAAAFWGIYLGFNWQVTPMVRWQLDCAYQRFNENTEGTEISPANHSHIVSNLWAVFRL